MPANNSKWQVHYWQGLYGHLGHLYSPGSAKGPYPHLPYALDNGAFPAWTKGAEWDEEAWTLLVKWAAMNEQQPLWALVPDVVASRDQTVARWRQYAPMLRDMLPNVPLAFAVQDGMTHGDVPADADLVFVGGSTEWKWDTVAKWCAGFPRVHVGRVNGYKGLKICYEAGAESTDGTGWFRGDKAQLRGLERFLQEQGCCENRPLTVVQEHTKRKRGTADIEEMQLSFLDNYL